MHSDHHADLMFAHRGADLRPRWLACALDYLFIAVYAALLAAAR